MSNQQSAIESLAQLGRDIVLRKTESGWMCSVSGLCWMKGNLETSFPTFGRTPEESASSLLNLLAHAKDGYVAHLRNDLIGTHQPVMIILVEKETK